MIRGREEIEASPITVTDRRIDSDDDAYDDDDDDDDGPPTLI